MLVIFTGITNLNESLVNLTVDSFDRIFVTDTVGHIIEMYDVDFSLIDQYESEGDEIGQFEWPYGLCIDEERHQLLVCDIFNNRIQKAQL